MKSHQKSQESFGANFHFGLDRLVVMFASAGFSIFLVYVGVGLLDAFSMQILSETFQDRVVLSLFLIFLMTRVCLGYKYLSDGWKNVLWAVAELFVLAGIIVIFIDPFLTSY